MIPSSRCWLGAALLLSRIVIARDDEPSFDTVSSWRAADGRTSGEAMQSCPPPCRDGSSSELSMASPFLLDGAGSATCNETMILEIVVQNKAENGIPAPVAIKACKAEFTSEDSAFPPENNAAAFCSTPNHEIIEASVFMGQLSSSTGITPRNKFVTAHFLSAGKQLLYSLGVERPSCSENVLKFAYSQSSVIGLYSGTELHQHGVDAEILNKLLEHSQEKSITKPTLVQICKQGGRGADYAVGIIAASAQDLPLAQAAVKTWADGRCVSTDANVDPDWTRVTLRVPSTTPNSSNSSTASVQKTSGSAHPAHIWGKPRIATRADTCRTITVNPGDGCWALANQCGISQSSLEDYNPGANFCSTLVAGQKVCCSPGKLPDSIPPANSDGSCDTIDVISGDSCGSLASKCNLTPAEFTQIHTSPDFCSTLAVGQPVCCTHGKLPDLRPKPNEDGSCATYTVRMGDSCSVIAASHSLDVADIEAFNKETWRWNGCQVLWPEAKICLSEGRPPFPAPVANAQCGPTVPGTEMPTGSSSTDWADLNPCPLNVCCNIWGQCGTTDDFCVISESESGAPGTSKPGENGCISNCGREIIMSSPPEKLMRVAYFESWNINRECLTMNVDQIDTNKYTHVHFAFANITERFQVDISGANDQFSRFKDMSGVKKIISFGGWDFSTKPDTYNILREATKPANRDTFRKSIVDFVNSNELDGVDIDWEYPGAPDIPGIPAGDPDAGEDYHRLLSDLKDSFDSSKSVSFAAPASYWYLKAFPMKKMGDKLDYIIYMTYDLHGQWDYGNKWTSPGCPTGNCLRSHVNLTETMGALSMITKAGVSSNKVVVGVASYGRSFKMAEAGCTGAMCKFTGSPRESNAAKGRCTDTRGYISNAELNEIVATGNVNKQWTAAGSDILVYDNTEWVAYMNDSIKANREKLYAAYNMAGTSDWAVDLQEFIDGNNAYAKAASDFPLDYKYSIDTDFYKECDASYNTLNNLEDRKSRIPPYCMDLYIAKVEAQIMSDALSKYDELIEDGYDDKFSTFASYVKRQVPDQINLFMANGHADDYFKCEETGLRNCCGTCRWNCEEDAECDDSPECENGRGTFEITCPTEFKYGDVGDFLTQDPAPNTTFTLEHENAFYKAIYDEYGIEKSWITFGDTLVYLNNGCQYSDDINACEKKHSYFYWNYPQASDNIEITNPKGMIGESYDESKDLLARLNVLISIADFDVSTDTTDLVDAAMLPALTMKTAVDSMSQVAEKAEEIEKQQRQEMILTFITGILFFIPFVGTAASAAGLTMVRSILGVLGSSAEAGLLAYSVVENPDNAFATIFSALATGGLGRGSWGKAANSKRDMSTEDIKKLGDIKDKVDRFDDLQLRSCKV